MLAVPRPAEEHISEVKEVHDYDSDMTFTIDVVRWHFD
jgi:hypothetical protein